MKNSIKRTLSMLLALTMVLSLGLPAYAVDASAGETGLTERGDLTIEEPSVQPGEEIIKDGDPKPAEEPVIPGDPVELPGMSGKITDLPVDGTIAPAEDPIGAEDIVLPEREDLFAEKTFNYADGNGFTVDVYAPAGALPDGVEMKVVRLDDLTAVQTAVDNAANVNGSVQLAADISFWLENEEIEPTAGSKLVVQMSAPEIVGVADPIVIHIPDGENAAPEIVEQLTNGDLEIAGTVSFAASDFSVYAIIGGEDPYEDARLLVKYKQADGSEVSYYVKKSDMKQEEIDGVVVDHFLEVVYDPGVGNIPDGKMFRGWTTKENYTAAEADSIAKTIDGVREEIKTKLNAGVTDGEVVTYYPIILNVRFVTYLDELGASIKNDVIKFKDGDTYTYTVQNPYTPRERDSRFDGWGEATVDQETGKYKITGELHANGSTITFSESKASVVLMASVPSGTWLMFKENGKGATYTAPQFILSEGKTVKPADPERAGYTFDGWYTGAPAQAGGDPTGSEFTAWNQKLEETTTLYAKWKMVESAYYTVVIWKQQSTGDKYDFGQSIRISGRPNTTVNTISAQNNNTPNEIRDDYARINGTNYRNDMGNGNNYTGFHLDHFDQNVNIKPEGNTVVNVYYHRNEYTLTFQAPPSATPNSGTNYQSMTVYTYVDVQGGYALRSTTLYTANGKWYTRSGNGYSGYRYTEYTAGVYSGNSYSTVKTITARYGASISNQFPIVGTNGVTYNSGERWEPQSNNVGWTKVMLKAETMPAGDVTFHLNSPQRPLKTMNYYVEALATDTGTVTAPTLYKGTNNTTVNPGTMKFKLDFTLNARYNGVTEEDLLDLEGFTFLGVDSRMSNGYYIYDTENDGTLNIYYTRDKFSIQYFDGIFVDKDGNPTDEEGSGDPHVGDKIYFGEDLTDHADDYEPTHTGYVLEGWFLDDACTTPFTFEGTTMPKGGINLYAKWRIIQYRVFLHPNVTKEEDPNFSMGGQATSFALSYGDYITPITGIREEYEQVGWYMSYNPETGEFSDPWNFDAYKGNDENITTVYNKTEETELTTPYATVEPGQEGYNKDKDLGRFWITKKLDLYLKWRLKLTGAEGIQVFYDAVEGEGEGTGKFADGTTLMADPVGFYTDTAIAIAQGASIANLETQEFKYWVLQKWDATANNGVGAYVDTETTVLPGGTFAISKTDAHMEPIEGADPEHDIYYLTYKVHLRAEYGSIEAPTPTHITWYSNVYDAAGNLIPDVQNRLEVGATPTYTNEEGETKNYDSVAFDANKGVGFTREEVVINNGIEIPAPDTYKMDGYTFLGWGRVDTAEESAASGNSVPGLTRAAASVTDPSKLNETNLFLKWVPSRDGETGHYEAQKPDGTWTEVEQVAADENHPYHDLYAVWGGTFQVVYTGAATPLTSIETYPINSTTATFDLMKTHSVDETTSAVTEGVLAIHTGYLYGGYYMDLPEASTTDEPYDGSNWTFDVSCAGTVNGKQIRPVGGVTYYVKEVPGNLSDNFLENYLKSKIIRTYYKKTDGTFDKTATIYLVSMIDGAVAEEGSTDLAAYKETGFIINKDVDKRVKAETVKTLVITAKDAKDETKPQAKYTATGTNGLMTYLKVYDRPNRNANAVQIDLAEDQFVQQYWITNDGWLVTGCAMRKYQNLDASGSMVKQTSADNWMQWIDPGTTPSAG